MEKIRICTICNQEKLLELFNKNKKCLEGYSRQCKACYNLKRYSSLNRDLIKIRRNNNYAKNKEENPEKYLTYLKEKREYRDKNKLRYMLIASKHRAKLDNIPFNLTLNDLKIPKYCPLLGIELKIEESKNNLAGPSIDKIIPELGYIKGNVEIISRKANMMKLNASFEELKTFSKNILEYISKYEDNIKKEEPSS